ncbi:hypothetical protein JKG47_04340 [Acidithiobacillus sp. MC6.1]|nr:hypothetical protein [Acidithiobacillus sp. MC6.1]
MSKKDPLAEYYKVMAKCQKDMEKAADSLLTLYVKARDAGLPGVRGADDNRLVLSGDIREFEHHLSDHLSNQQK